MKQAFAILTTMAMAASAVAAEPPVMWAVGTHGLPDGAVALVSGVDPIRIEFQAPQPHSAAAADPVAGDLSQEATTSCTWTNSAGTLRSNGVGAAVWRAGASDPGAPARIEVQWTRVEQWSTSTGGASSSAAVDAKATLVLLPGVAYDRDGDGSIAGTFVGIYPNEFGSDAPAVVQRNPSAYRPPEQLYRVDATTRTYTVGAGRSLGFFAPSPFGEDAARFVAFDARLVTFWGSLEREVDAAKWMPAGLKVLRGFVSPQERQRMERMDAKLARFTRYQYGDALAIVLDRDGDYRMDDLNGDGAVTIEDAAALAQVVEKALADVNLRGGIGICAAFEGPNHVGTPYVHVDLRGWSDVWREE